MDLTIRIKMVLVLLIWFMPLIVMAYTDAEIVALISESISEHSTITLAIVSLFLTGLGGSLIWLFTMVNQNRKSVIEHEELRHIEHIEVLKKMEESCDHVDAKLNKHALDVAQNYVRDEKIEKMLERTMKPLQDQLINMQRMISHHYSSTLRRGDKD